MTTFAIALFACSLVCLIVGISLIKDAFFWKNDNKLRQNYIEEQERKLGEKLDYYKGCTWEKPSKDEK